MTAAWMRCEAPFFAGDAFRPETLILAYGCESKATQRIVRKNVIPNLRVKNANLEALACGTHVRAFETMLTGYRRAKVADEALPFVIESLEAVVA